ncbi:unnamed protein product [Ectocarpus sp. 12 AP-2014]
MTENWDLNVDHPIHVGLFLMLRYFVGRTVRTSMYMETQHYYRRGMTVAVLLWTSSTNSYPEITSLLFASPHRLLQVCHHGMKQLKFRPHQVAYGLGWALVRVQADQ